MVYDNLMLAFAEIANIKTVLLMIVGVGAGLLAGSIPGFTIAMAVVLTLPFTFSMPPEQGLAMMISVLVGGLSGGLMSGILIGMCGRLRVGKGFLNAIAVLVGAAMCSAC